MRLLSQPSLVERETRSALLGEGGRRGNRNSFQWDRKTGCTSLTMLSSIGHSVGRLARKDFRFLGCGDRSILDMERREGTCGTVNGHRLHFHSRVTHHRGRGKLYRDAPCCVCTRADRIRPRKSPNRHALAFYVRRTFLIIVRFVRTRSSGR